MVGTLCFDPGQYGDEGFLCPNESKAVCVSIFPGLAILVDRSLLAIVAHPLERAVLQAHVLNEQVEHALNSYPAGIWLQH